jgi:hypothetical protein
MDPRLNQNRYEMINLLIRIYDRLQVNRQQQQGHESSTTLIRKNLAQSSIKTIFRDILDETLR